MPYRDRGKWRGVVKVGGARTTAAFPPTKDGWRQAVQWEADERKKRTAEPTPQTIHTGFVRLYNEYLRWCEMRYSHDTLTEKRTLAKRLLKFIGSDFDVATVTPRHISDFMLQRASEKSKNAANVARKNLLAFWSWMRKTHGMTSNPVAALDTLPHSRAAQYIPPESDILQLLAVATRTEKVFLNCYLQTAARRSSVFRWKWGEDIDFHLRQVRIGTAKTRDGSTEYLWLPMTDELYQDLQWWYRNRDNRDSPHVWTVLSGPYAGNAYSARRKFLSGLCDRAGIRRMGFHALRRYAATRLASCGVSMSLIQRILGHKALSTTERYLGRANEDLRSTMQLLGHNQRTTRGTEQIKTARGDNP